MAVTARRSQEGRAAQNPAYRLASHFSLRGLAFSLAEDFDWTTALVVEDTRKDYPEPRYQALGLLGELLHMLVFTPRRETVHVISLRRANRRERTSYAAQTEPRID